MIPALDYYLQTNPVATETAANKVMVGLTAPAARHVFLAMMEAYSDRKQSDDQLRFGLIRSTGALAAGTVITPEPLDDPVGALGGTFRDASGAAITGHAADGGPKAAMGGNSIQELIWQPVRSFVKIEAGGHASIVLLNAPANDQNVVFRLSLIAV